MSFHENPPPDHAFRVPSSVAQSVGETQREGRPLSEWVMVLLLLM